MTTDRMRLGRAVLLSCAAAVSLLGFAAPAGAAPANDAFSAATSLSSALPSSIAGSNVEATKEGDEPNHAGELGGHSVWYSWTSAASVPVDISTCTPFSTIDSLLAVYTGSAVDSLTPVAANDDGATLPMFPACRGTDSEVSFTAVAGTTYRIAVDGASDSVGNLFLQIRSRPGNDDFANPELLNPSLPTNAVFDTTTRLATKEPGEPNHAGNPGGHSVWFSWTPAASGPVAITACGNLGNADPLLAVYTGTDVGALNPIANDDGTESEGCPFHSSEVRFTASVGTTYRIAVDGKDGIEGRFTLNLEGGPANDAFASAQVLGPGLPASGFTNTKLAGKQVGEPNHAGDPGGHSVWYSWTPSASGLVEITACPYNETGLDPLLAVYTGASVGGLTPVASNDNGADCAIMASAVQLSANAGTTYWIAVDGKAGSSGIFSLEIQHALPQNDDFADAEELSPTPLFAGGSTKLASKEIGEPNHAGNPGGHSVWFSWTPSASGPVSLTACATNGSKLDALLAVYTGSTVGGLSQVAANDDAVDPPPNEICSATASEVQFSAGAGTTYKIAVDDKGANTGRFMLAFELGPSANDDFADASPLQATLQTSALANNRFAGKEIGEPNHAGNPGGHSVWFSWTAPSSGPVAIWTCTNWGKLDALLAVYTGAAVDALTPVAAADDGASDQCRASDSEVQIDATAGTTYWIAVDGKADSTGQLQLFLEGVAANDDFGKPQPLGAQLPVRFFFGSNRFATKQADEPDHAGDAGGHSVWYKWTAPRSGEVSVDACGSGFDALVAVYTGTAVDSLTPVASTGDGSSKCAPQSRLSFDAVANTVYKIAVDGKAGAEGPVNLTVDEPPANDDFGDSEGIRAKLPTFISEGSTLLAGKQPGEPNHAGDAGGYSVWYSWTPSASGPVEITACTGTFDPVLAVYTGSAVGALTPVATTGAALRECDEGNGIRFSAIAGTTYRIAVDGAGGDDGHFELWFEAAAADPVVIVDPPPTPAGGGGNPPVSNPPAPQPPKPLKCKRGFKKVRVKGKPKCVKKKKAKHGRHKGKHR